MFASGRASEPNLNFAINNPDGHFVQGRESNWLRHDEQERVAFIQTATSGYKIFVHFYFEDISGQADYTYSKQSQSRRGGTDKRQLDTERQTVKWTIKSPLKGWCLKTPFG
jgi:hypothetical protein